jgi:adenylate cyclase
MMLGLTYAYGGLREESLAEVAIATRLGPRDPFASPAILSTTGLCHFLAGRYSEAIEFERRAVQASSSFGTAWRTLAAAAGVAGDTETAASALAQAKRLQPNLSLDWVEKYHPIVRADDRAVYIDGLRKAGLR